MTAAEDCPRCGHRYGRGYGLRIIPHTTNKKTPEGRCHNCLDCFNERNAERAEHKRAAMRANLRRVIG